MQKLLVEGGLRLGGRVEIAGAKNAVLKLMAATLLGKGTFQIRNVPMIKDVFTMQGMLSSLGPKISLANNVMEIKVDELSGDATSKLVQQMRASIQVLGPLLARLGKVTISLPGGCAIGDRPIDLHLDNLEKLGARFFYDNGYIVGEATQLVGTELVLSYPSVGATENLMMAACLAEGTTIIRRAAKEPEIVDLQNFLNKMGARVVGAGTETIRIDGVKSLHETEFSVSPDRIEAGTFVIAGAITGDEIEIENVESKHLESLLVVLKNCNVHFTVEKKRIVIHQRRKPLTGTNIVTGPYPAFPTDLQPQFTALMTVAKGNSEIKETVYNNRFQHAIELQKMGANITLNSSSARITGVEKLVGTSVTAADLRGGAALVVAALVADGITEISGVEHIDRGYENFEHKLNALGAKVWRQ
ncbi:MAG: UDP-N-acetylglucosamine 1-carboxyvinyltransferase [Firmicutes bacterium]|nr:UDP-N-acetylglucosamine 1-carboxyvinyltransferase [Bacillota bacterium]